jgi:single-strand DNA-binding protein
MNNLNQILIEGNVVRNPELKYTPKGTPLCTFSVASNRYYKQEKQNDDFEKEVSFFDVTTWTDLAQTCATELKKGRGVRVIGRLKQDRWQDPDGKNRSKVYIVADHVIFKPEFKDAKSEMNREKVGAEVF